MYDIKLFQKRAKEMAKIHENCLPMIEEFRRNKEFYIQMDKNIRSNIRFIEETYQIFNDSYEYINEINNTLNSLKGQMDNFYDEFNFEYYKNLQKIYDNFNKTNQISNQFALILIEFGWPPVLDIFSNQVEDIIKMYETEESKDKIEGEIGGLFVNFYTEERLKRKLDEWKNNELLNDRIYILKTAVEAHIKENYVLVVPTLLSQIEGIIADGFNHKGRMGGRKLKSYISKLTKNNRIDEFDDVVNKFLLNIVLVNFEHGKPINSSLSRHAILHGADKNYGTKKNSLKTIILFDYLQDAFSEKNEKLGVGI